jgi:hypothetical protein
MRSPPSGNTLDWKYGYDAIAKRGRGAVVVAEPAPPHHGVHRRHRVDADHLGGWDTAGDGHGAGSLPERRVTSARRTVRNTAVRSCFEWVEPTGRREHDGGKAQPTAGRGLLLARTPDVGVREEDQTAVLTGQAG